MRALPDPPLQDFERTGLFPDDKLRRWALQVFAVICLGLSLVWGIGHAALGNWILTGVFGTCVLAGVFGLLALHRGFPVAMIGHLMLATALLGVSLATFYTGGLRGANVTPFFMCVVAAVFLLGRRGMPWAMLAVAVVFGFQIAHWVGVEFVDMVPASERSRDNFQTWALALGVVFAFILLYELARVRALEQVRQASQAKSRFLANVGHELRTPLHTILGMQAQLAESSLSTIQASLLKAAEQSAHALDELVSELLDLAAVEQGRFGIHAEPFDLHAAMDNLGAAAALSCDSRGLVFEQQRSSNLPQWVSGDRRRLRQILLNLLENAAKFTSEGGVRLEIGLAPQDSGPPWCRFDVLDTGEGIPEPDRQRIFDSFVQLDGSATRRHEGAGLGLAISRELIERMGGEIQLDSAEGVGSRFTVVLPLPPIDLASIPELTPVEPVAPVRVLMVEDNADNRMLARLMLEKLGHQVLEAEDGEQGFERWQQEQPELVLMDIQMPVLDGLTATRRIRAAERDRHPARPTPIVAMTGQAAPGQDAQLRDAGFDGFLFRPFDRLELERVIRRCLSRVPGSAPATTVEPVSGPDMSPKK